MAPLEFKATEVVLFAGGAVLTVAVLVFAVVLFRSATREHREELERERRRSEEGTQREPKEPGA